jgi:GDP-4-dehydro-6-deoxy-D-mannose reductase
VSARALITGGSGFVGQWLVRALVERGWSVTAASMSAAPEVGLLSASERDAVQWLSADVRVAADVRRAVEASTPEFVFHLAGVSYVPDAREAPELAYEVNMLGAVRLLSELNRCRRAGVLDPVVLVVGSATQYGRHELAEMPLTEAAAQRPADVYGASKAAQEVAALQFFRSEGLRVICTRSFNHSGPGHAAHFLLPALIQRVLALRGQSSAELRLGNQDSVRDYLHVADVVNAYLLLVERGVPGDVYNVCSENGVSVRELAASVLQRAGVTADITTDAALVRGVDIPALVGSSAKLQQTTGWRPTRTRTDIIDDLIHAATH